jgi:hypothetical protein
MPNSTAQEFDMPQKFPGFLTRFITKHNRLIVFFGALIVFATFIVREGLREELKSFVDSIDSAESLFLLQRENALMAGRMAEILRIVTATNANIQNPPRGGIPHIDLIAEELHYQDGFDTIQRMADELAAAGRLLKKIPHSADDALALARFQSKYDVEAGSFKLYKQPGSVTPQPELEQAFNVVVSTENGLWDIEANLAEFTASLLETSRKVKERDERYFELATWWSYGLYALGWGLGLVGKLYGPKGDGSVEIL